MTPDDALPVEPPARVPDSERLRRWRLVLGSTGDTNDEGGARAEPPTSTTLHGDDVRVDAALAAVYDTRPSPASSRRGGASRAGSLARSAPRVARWLGDIRRYFPAAVVQVIQRDAIERLQLRQLLLEPEMLRAAQPDLRLVSLLVELNHLLPDTTRATARSVVRQVVVDLERRLAPLTRQAVSGALTRALRTRRPRAADIDWDSTIRANLRTWRPEHATVIPERLVGRGRRRPVLAKDVIVAIDQSGSMADSIVYAAVFGAVLASMPSLRTTVVAFDTEVADLTAVAGDPVELLFAVQLGGGTDLANAMAFCRGAVSRPYDTVLVVISDLYEGGDAAVFESEIVALVRSGVTVVALLALSDEGAPAYDHHQAARLAGLGVAAFACTPELFPDLLAAALEGRDLASWAAGKGVATAAVPGDDW